jgi:hypothetical protein
MARFYRAHEHPFFFFQLVLTLKQAAYREFYTRTHGRRAPLAYAPTTRSHDPLARPPCTPHRTGLGQLQQIAQAAPCYSRQRLGHGNTPASDLSQNTHAGVAWFISNMDWGLGTGRWWSGALVSVREVRQSSATRSEVKMQITRTQLCLAAL